MGLLVNSGAEVDLAKFTKPLARLEADTTLYVDKTPVTLLKLEAPAYGPNRLEYSHESIGIPLLITNGQGEAPASELLVLAIVCHVRASPTGKLGWGRHFETNTVPTPLGEVVRFP